MRLAQMTLDEAEAEKARLREEMAAKPAAKSEVKLAKRLAKIKDPTMRAEAERKLRLAFAEMQEKKRMGKLDNRDEMSGTVQENTIAPATFFFYSKSPKLHIDPPWLRSCCRC